MAEILYRDETQREYETVRAELRSLQWRTTVLLLGSTFLVFFWFSSVGGLLLRAEALYLFRSALSFPFFINAASWVVWLMPDMLSVSGPWRPTVDREREYTSDYERR